MQAQTEIESKNKIFGWQRSVFRMLFISMLAFGVLVGVIFPFFTKAALGYDEALSAPFAIMCIAAGIFVGLLNFLLFNALVSRELGKVARGMDDINDEMNAALYQEETQEVRQLEVESDDKIGELVRAFNSMGKAIAERMNLEKDLRDLMTKLSGSVDFKKVSHAIIEELVELTGALGGGVLYGSLAGELELLSFSGIKGVECFPASIKADGGVTSAAVADCKMRILHPDQEGREWATIFTQGAQFFPPLVLLIPLCAENHSVGLIVLGCHRPYLSVRRRKLLETFRFYVAPYLQNVLLHRKIQEIASEDGLTGCLNRRYGMRRLQEEFSLEVRKNGNISLILIDIDHFKKINDTYGHAAGDHALKAISARFKENIRTGEVVCRYGGEEFLIVVPGGNREETGQLAERLRKAIAEKKIPWAKEQLALTISLGLATWPGGGGVGNAEELVNEADDALYFAKEAGRNLTAVNFGDHISLLDN